jgi:hypothetical protein
MQWHRDKVFKTRLNLWRLEGPPVLKDSVLKADARKLSLNDVGAITAVHRNEALVRKRLNDGHFGCWLEIGGACAHVAWYAIHRYSVWDIRCELLLPEGSSYMFDVFTAPAFRRIGAASLCMRKAFTLEDHPGRNNTYALIRVDNLPAEVAASKIGFERVATVSLIQFPPVRLYNLIPGNGVKQSLIRFMQLHTKPARLDLENLAFV